MANYARIDVTLSLCKFFWKIIRSRTAYGVKVRPDGSLAVLKNHVEQQFGANAKTANMPMPRIEPNWGALA